MQHNSLTQFIEKIREIWGPLNSNLLAKSQLLLEALAKVPDTERWLTAIQGDLSESRELFRDANYGFLLLAHTENEGMYRLPHDHRSGWVLYSVQKGEMEMGTYGRIPIENGEQLLVQRDSYRVRQGESRVNLPGDIHDTKCISSSVLMLRLTSVDLKEEKRAGRMNQYAHAK
jgi:hypothetical protein